MVKMEELDRKQKIDKQLRLEERKEKFKNARKQRF